MKKLLAVLLMLSMIFTISACSSVSENADVTSTDIESTSAEKADVTDEETTNVVESTTKEEKTTKKQVKETEKEIEKTTEKICSHKWSAATCKKAKTCTICGKTEGSKGKHSYSDGKCINCGASDPSVEEIIEILNKCERYVTYIELNGGILEAEIERYRINDEASTYVEITETVITIAGYYEEMRQLCEPKKHDLYPLYTECDDGLPEFSADSIAGASTYARQAKRIRVVYDLMCENYGL